MDILEFAPQTHPDTHEIFKALGHPARIAILRKLADGEKCVCDLVDVAGLGWSSVSRHLSVMKHAGVIADEKRGQNVFYSLKLPCVADFIACLDDPETCRRATPHLSFPNRKPVSTDTTCHE